MIPATARAIVASERVHESQQASARLRAMLGAIKGPPVQYLSDAELAGFVASRTWSSIHHDARTGAFVDKDTSRDLIFNTFIFDDRELAGLLARHPALAVLGWAPFTWRGPWNHEGCACQGAWELHSLNGCLHACAYCHVNEFLHVMLDVENLAARVEPLARANPAQHLYKYDNRSDQIALEPEYGASMVMVERFATLDLAPPRYLLLYTKSDNVDHLLDLDHRGRTIVNWSLAPPAQATRIETGTPPVDRRIDAMRKCQEAGYHVRARFSPVIPVEGWREEYAGMISTLFQAARPDVITLDVIGFMSPAGLLASIDPDLLDGKARAIIDSLAKADTLRPRTWQKHLFPAPCRVEVLQFIYEEIRKHDATVPVALCNETLDVWDALASNWTPRMDPGDYACCCGPTSVPGNPWLRP